MRRYKLNLEFYAEAIVPAEEESAALDIILKSVSNVGAPGLLEALNIRRVRVTHIREEADNG